jgi:hypothetical protein
VKALLIFCGIALILLALACVATLVSAFDLLKECLVNGTPVFFEHGGVQRQFPGRVIGILALLIPIASMVIGIWLIRVGHERENKRDT